MSIENPSGEEKKIGEPEEEKADLYAGPDGTIMTEDEYRDEMERREADPTRWRDVK